MSASTNPADVASRISTALVATLIRRSEMFELVALTQEVDATIAKLEQRIMDAPAGQEWIDVTDCSAVLLQLMRVGGWKYDGTRLLFPKNLASPVAVPTALPPTPQLTDEVIVLGAKPAPIEDQKNENGKRVLSNGTGEREKEIEMWKKRAKDHSDKYQQLCEQIENSDSEQQKAVLERSRRTAEEGYNFCVKAEKMLLAED